VTSPDSRSATASFEAMSQRVSVTYAIRSRFMWTADQT
jgi:hypothetical protein